MVLLDRVIFCPEVPLEERKRCVPSLSIALVARRHRSLGTRAPHCTATSLVTSLVPKVLLGD